MISVIARLLLMVVLAIVGGVVMSVTWLMAGAILHPGQVSLLLESIVAGRNPEVASLARLALADLLQAEGKKDEARGMYQYLVDHPTDLVPAPRAQLALAKILIESDPQKAREMLESLQAMPGAISVTAVNLMSRLPVTE